MDGMKCYFTRLNEVEAWEAAQKADDSVLALFGLLLTEKDVTFLHKHGIKVGDR